MLEIFIIFSIKDKTHHCNAQFIANHNQQVALLQYPKPMPKPRFLLKPCIAKT